MFKIYFSSKFRISAQNRIRPRSHPIKNITTRAVVRDRVFFARTLLFYPTHHLLLVSLVRELVNVRGVLSLLLVVSVVYFSLIDPNPKQSNI